MSVLALDYGAKTVGGAVTTSLGTAQAIGTIRREKENHLRKTLRQIEDWIKTYNVDTIVVGHPKNMDGTIGERAGKSEEFADMLKDRTGLPVFLRDERLTSVEAEEILRELGKDRREIKEEIDSIAAVLILEDYMSSAKEGIVPVCLYIWM